MQIAVLGAGTWGTALARLLVKNKHHVTLWSKIPQELEAMQRTHRHPNLPEAVIPEALQYDSMLDRALAGVEIIVFAVPSPFVRATAEEAAPYLKEGQILVDVAKGIEKDSGLTLTEVIGDVLQAKRPELALPLVALSGPTHAEEVSRDLPSAIVAACREDAAAHSVQDAFMNENFRVYTNHDVHGVELCGALKNIIALAAGISDGLGFGDNTKAALMTRGMAEMTRLGLALGCEPSTFSGLAGYGDLIVTATSVHSRNHRCGVYIGQGVPVPEAIRKVGQVVEGMNALPAAQALSSRCQVEMPLVDAVAMVLDGRDVRETVLSLMTREKKREFSRH